MPKRICLLLWMLLPIIFADAQQVAKTLKLNPQDSIQYLIYHPDSYEPGIQKNYPLLLFLHGGGESGDSIHKVKTHGPPRLVEEGKSFPFFVLSPLNKYPRGLWDDRAIMQLLDSVVAELPVDTNRIYLTGLSRGGHGVWRTAINNPNRFAAIAPVCGMSLPPYAGWIKDIPAWVFHGGKDTVIPVQESIDMVDELKKLGADVRLTIYPDAGHDSWTETYNNDSLYIWFLQNER